MAPISINNRYETRQIMSLFMSEVNNWPSGKFCPLFLFLSLTFQHSSTNKCISMHYMSRSWDNLRSGECSSCKSWNANFLAFLTFFSFRSGLYVNKLYGLFSVIFRIWFLLLCKLFMKFFSNVLLFKQPGRDYDAGNHQFH